MAKPNLSPKIHLNKDNFESLLQDRVNNEISKYVINTNEIDESMRYALSNPGKRVRPLLAYLVGDVLNLDLNKIRDFEKDLYELIKSSHSDIIENVNTSGDLDDDTSANLKSIIEEFKKNRS